MSDDKEHAYVAKYGNVTLKSHTFAAIGDLLLERGFIMEDAKPVKHNVVEIPHVKEGRKSARLEYCNGHTVEDVKTVELIKSPEIISSELVHQKVMADPLANGIAIRDCGSVHTDGIICVIPTWYRSAQCTCGDTIYAHKGPHEGVTDDGIKYRWEEVLIIRDLPFNAYGPLSDEELSEGVE